MMCVRCILEYVCICELCANPVCVAWNTWTNMYSHFAECMAWTKGSLVQVLREAGFVCLLLYIAIFFSSPDHDCYIDNEPTPVIMMHWMRVSTSKWMAWREFFSPSALLSIAIDRRRNERWTMLTTHKRMWNMESISAQWEVSWLTPTYINMEIVVCAMCNMHAVCMHNVNLIDQPVFCCCWSVRFHPLISYVFIGEAAPSNMYGENLQIEKHKINSCQFANCK